MNSVSASPAGRRFSERTFLGSISILLGSSLIVFQSSLIILSSGLFILGVPLGPFHLVAAACIAAFVLWKGTKKYLNYNDKNAQKVFVIILLSVISAVLILSYFCGKFYDLSSDSQSSYEEAIYLLSKGWNPVHVADLPQTTYSALVASAYAKGTWLYPAIMNMITNNIETGKSFNFLLMLSCFFFSFAGFLSFPGIGTVKAFVLSFALSANPVSITQSLSYYADGSLMNILTILAFLGLLLYFKSDNFLLLVFAAAIILALTIKMIALMYVPIFCLAILSYFVFSKKNLRKMSVVIIMSILIGIILAGYSPYVTNAINHGNPFYNPSISYDKSDFKKTFFSSGKSIIPKSNKPANFYNDDGTEKNNIEKLVISLFSRSRQMTSADTEFKIPGTFSFQELEWFSYPDIRIGGFGPLFSGILLLAAGISLLETANVKSSITAASVILWVMFSTLINPESWWARYAPQIFFVPFVAVVLAACNDNKKKIITPWLSNILVLFLVANVFLISDTYYNYQYRKSINLKKQLERIYAYSVDKPIYVHLRHYGNHIRLEQSGINFITSGDRCEHSENLVDSDTTVCLGN